MLFVVLIFQLNNPSDAIKQCNEALKIDENDVDALCDRAEAHILNEMYDEGTKMSFLTSLLFIFNHQCYFVYFAQLITLLHCIEIHENLLVGL